MIITEQTTKEIDIAKIEELTEAVGWGCRGEKKWQEVLLKSSYVYSLWEQERLVGFGRILEDGVMCMMYDIAVHPHYQSQGLGARIMNSLIGQVKDKQYVSIGLFTWEDSSVDLVPYYEKFGFKKVTTGMELTKYMTRE